LTGPTGPQGPQGPSSPWVAGTGQVSYTDGRVLVGTSSTSGAAKLQVQGYVGDDNGLGLLALRVGSSSPANGSSIGRIDFNDSTDSRGASIGVERDGGTWGASSKPSRLVFSTTADGASSPTERMRISQAGITSLRGSDDVIYCSSNAAAGSTYRLFRGGYNASAVDTATNSVSIFTNGNIQNTNNSYGSLSDIKLKENIVDAGSQWNDLKALQVRKYNLKEGQTHTQIGLIAQEAELVSPGLVYETPDLDEDGNETGEVTKGVNYSVLYMKAVKALQEAMERIEQLETSNADLLVRVTALETA
jgi:hypothetical protein